MFCVYPNHGSLAHVLDFDLTPSQNQAMSKGSSIAPYRIVSSGEEPPVPYRDGDATLEDTPALCKCKLKCIKLVSWNVDYPGRRYYRCRNVGVSFFSPLKLTNWLHVFDPFVS